MDNSSKILRLLKSKEKTILNNIKKNIDKNLTDNDILQFIIDDAHEYINAEGLQSISSKHTTDWRKEQSKYDDLIKKWAKSIMKKIKLKNEDILKNKIKTIIKEELFNLTEERYEGNSLIQIRLKSVKNQLENILDDLREKNNYLNSKKKLTKDPDVDKDILTWKNVNTTISKMYTEIEKLDSNITKHLKSKVLKLGN